jgi:hypothetical protein
MVAVAEVGLGEVLFEGVGEGGNLDIESINARLHFVTFRRVARVMAATRRNIAPLTDLHNAGGFGSISR